MDAGDIVAVTEAVALIGTWYWTLRRRRDLTEKRQGYAKYALGLATVAVILDLAMTLLMHFRTNPNDSLVAKTFLVVLPAGLLCSLAGLGCGIIGKGTPRIAGIVWSLCMIAIYGFSVLQLLAATN